MNEQTANIIEAMIRHRWNIEIEPDIDMTIITFSLNGWELRGSGKTLNSACEQIITSLRATLKIMEATLDTP